MKCRHSLFILFLLFSGICNAQDSTSQWTWMKGEETIPEYAIYGQRGVPSKNNTPGPRFESCKWTDKAGRLWLFGGKSMDPIQNHLLLNDLWQYDPSSDEWTWISGDSTTDSKPVYGIKGVPDDKNTPGSLSNGEYWTDSSGNFWLYGPVLWKYNPVTYQWTWITGDSVNNGRVYGTKGVPGIINTPGPRYASTSWIDKNGNFWLYGNGVGSTNDLWKYDPSLNMWAWMKGDSVFTTISPVYGSKGLAGVLNTPNVRSGSVSFTDNNGNLWLFGGYQDQGGTSLSGFFNDLWKYNILSNEWTWVNGDSVIDAPGQLGPQGIPSAINKPGGSTGGNAWVDASGNFWMQGGALWKYNPTSNLWTWISSGLGFYGQQGKADNRNYPVGRIFGMSWVDSNGTFWLFGGDRNFNLPGGDYEVGDLLNDLWKYDLTTGLWTWMKGGNSSGDYSTQYGVKGVADAGNNPGPRRYAITWIDGSDNLWLFGGEGAFLNDFWKYSPVSNTWTWMMGDSTIYTGTGVFGTRGVPAAGNIPPMRSDGVSWKDQNGNFWMYGGLSGQPFDNSLNDLWKYDLLTGMWAWMDGEQTVDAPPVFGTMGIPAPGNTPGALYSSASWIDKSGNLWLFGGSNTHALSNAEIGFSNNLWKYNVTSNEWTRIQGDDTVFATGHFGKKGVASAFNRPAAKLGCIYWTDADGYFWLYGGQTTIYSPLFDHIVTLDLNDLWKYDPSINQWTWMNGDSSTFVNGAPRPISAIFGEKGIEGSLNTPGPAENSGSWIDRNGNLWLSVGGTLWRYNRKTNNWAWMDGDSSLSALSSYGTQGIPSANNNPGSRFSSISWTDSKNNFWLSSGAAVEKSILIDFGDLWRYIPSLSLPTQDSSVVIGDTTLLTGSIKVFPNPFRNVVSVTSSQTDSIAVIRAYAISGALLLQLNTSSLRTDIDMSRYPAGAYIIILENKNYKRMGWKKIIKQ